MPPPPKISQTRKAFYLIGSGLTALGGILFISFFFFFISSFVMFSKAPSLFGRSMTIFHLFLLPVSGMCCMIVGQIIRSIAAKGLAGSGVILDPNQAREDLEPWSRAAGGIIHDAIDASGLKPSSAQNSYHGAPHDASTPAEEKLRRLKAMRNEGLITEAEYAEKRQQILDTL